MILHRLGLNTGSFVMRCLGSTYVSRVISGTTKKLQMETSKDVKKSMSKGNYKEI